MTDIDIKYTQLFINNEFVNSESGKSFATYNPATERCIAEVQEAGVADVNKAVAAALKAFQPGSEWRQMDAPSRSELLLKFSRLMRRDLDYLAKLESLDNGKHIEEGLFDVDWAVKSIEYFAGWSDKTYGKTIPAGSDSDFLCYTRHEPVGVVAGIITLTYPVLMLCWKMCPALAAGNTVILKPSEHTPLSALYVASLIKEAGFPAGVVNVLPGFGPVTGKALCLHNDVNKVSFTGRTENGKLIQQYSAQSNLKRIHLGLSGKSPFIIMDINDEDLTKAANETNISMFTNQGQSCIASSRCFVHESVYDSFIAKMKEIAESKVVGDQFSPKTTSGAITKPEQFKKVLEYIEIGKKEGARLVCGGKRIGKYGHFVEPTIFADVEDHMVIAKDEILGPVLCITKFNDVKDVIRRANDTIYGLGAGVYTNDFNQAMKFTNSLKAGCLYVNCFEAVMIPTPFGGMKQSGVGRDLCEYVMSEYTEVKNVTIKLD